MTDRPLPLRCMILVWPLMLALGACTVPDSTPTVEASGDGFELAGRAQEFRYGGVTLDSLLMGAPGYAVVYADGGGAPGVQIGASELLAAGGHNDLTIPVDYEAAGSSVFVLIHVEDSGNESMDFPAGDPPAQGGSGAVAVALEVTR